MAEAELLQRIKELEEKHERLHDQVKAWIRNESNQIHELRSTLERLEGRLKDLDKIEQVAYLAYEATHPEAHQTIWAVNKVLDDAATRIFLRHQKALSKRDDGASF